MPIKRFKDLSYRQTVKSAKKAYKYRQWDPTTARIRVKSGYGFDDGSLTKLAFKNGKLTVAGELYRDSIMNIKEKNKREYTLREFDKYVKTMKQKNRVTTIASFESHMYDTDYDRMLYNMNIKKEELEEALMKKYNGNTINGLDINVIVNDFTLLTNFITFNYEEG